MGPQTKLEADRKKSTREAFFVGNILCEIINKVDSFEHGKTVYAFLNQLESDNAFSSFARRVFIDGTKRSLLKKMTELPSSFDQKTSLLKTMSYDYLAGSPEKDIRNYFAMGHLHDHVENSFEQWIELFKILDHLYPTRDEDEGEEKAFNEKRDRCFRNIERIIRDTTNERQKTEYEIQYLEMLKLDCTWRNWPEFIENNIEPKIGKLRDKLEAMKS